MDGSVRSILVADDDEPIRKRLVEFFDALGYEVMAVGSAVEAISTVINRKVDALILKMELPGLTGYDVAPMIRKIDPDVRVILTVEDDPEEHENETVQTEHFECWTQPLNLGRLLNSIREGRPARPPAEVLSERGHNRDPRMPK